MKTLDRCTLKMGQEIIIKEALRGDDIQIGDRLKVRGFQCLPETVKTNFKLDSTFFVRGENVFTKLYLAEKDGDFFFVWPEETLNGQKEIKYF